GDLGVVQPGVQVQVRVVVVHPGVDVRHDGLHAARGDVPGLGGVDVVAGAPARLAGVVQAVQRGKAGVVGDHVRVGPRGGLGVEDAGELPVGLEGVRDAAAGGEVDLVEPGDAPQGSFELGARGDGLGLQAGGQELGVEADEEA